MAHGKSFGHWRDFLVSTWAIDDRRCPGNPDASGTTMPKIIVHIDRGGDWSTTQWFFDNLNAQSVPYDMIGESYYTFFQDHLPA